MLRLIFVGVCLLGMVSGTCQKPREIWTNASEAYEQGKYNAAVAGYLELEGSKPSDELFFNIGNCYYNLDSTARSILYFERALKLNPRNSEARDNLDLVRLKMSEPIIAIDQFFLLAWITAISESIPPLGWGLFLIGLIWLLAWLHIKAFRERRPIQLRYKILAIAAVVMVMGIGYFSYDRSKADDMAIVMSSSDIRVAPDTLSQLVKEIEGGEKVAILDSLGGFYKVRLVNYEVGWIAIEAVEFI